MDRPRTYEFQGLRPIARCLQNSMAKTKALCIFTTLLGYKATTRGLMDTLDRTEDVDPTYVLLNAEDYSRYRTPWWTHVSNPWEAQYIARQKVRPVLNRHFDILLVNSWEFVIAFRSLARKIPAAALIDSVPATVDAQLRRRGCGGWKRNLSAHFHHHAFGGAVRSYQYFLPMGSDSADSLENCYQVKPENCFVTLAPQNLDFWKPGPRTFSPRLRLLFVANDFARKGGDFLLRLYAGHLAGTCTLTIASNDPSLERRALPPGVVWKRGCDRAELRQVYRESDLFLFPMLQDFMPQVLAEALATGLPCIANDVGGIRDLVHDDQNGFLMPYDSTEKLWADRIADLRSNPVELARLARGARAFAIERLGMRRFEEVLCKVLNRLRSGGIDLPPLPVRQVRSAVS